MTQQDKGRKTTDKAMPILELRRFLADELDGNPVDGDFGRAFTPLTDGLGIQAPAPKPADLATKAAAENRALESRKSFDVDPMPVAPKAPPAPIMVDEVEEVFAAPAVKADRAAVLAALGDGPATTMSIAVPVPIEEKIELEVDETPAPKAMPLVPDTGEDLTPTERLQADRFIERATRPVEPTWSGERIFLEEEDPRRGEVQPRPMTIPELPTSEHHAGFVPPPMPNATLGRRALSAVLDQAFVLTLWGITLTITSLVLGGGLPTSFEMLAAGMRKEPVYWRFAILSFATLWLAHFAIGLGLVDRTFGMWVWGLKVRAFGKTDDASFFRRLSRIVLSFFFYAPIVPVLLLMPRYKGRNLLDWMTGTALYRTLE